MAAAAIIPVGAVSYPTDCSMNLKLCGAEAILARSMCNLVAVSRSPVLDAGTGDFFQRAWKSQAVEEFRLWRAAYLWHVLGCAMTRGDPEQYQGLNCFRIENH